MTKFEVKIFAGLKDLWDLILSVSKKLFVRGPGFDTRSGNITRFFFRFFKKGSCQLLAKVCARSTG